MVFSLSAGIAGFGGVMLGLFNFTIGGVNPSYALVYTGLFWLAIAVTFGIRRPGGALLGGFAFAAGTAIFHWIATDLLPEIFNWVGIELGNGVNRVLTSVYFIPILSGLAAINLAQEPDGILSLVGQQRLAKQRQKRRQARIAATEAAAHAGTVPDHEIVHATPETPVAAEEANGEQLVGAMFAMSGVVAGYGDAEVLHGVDLRLDAGKVTALLGANGAGKSTLCSVAAGLVEATLGTVSLEGRDITGEHSYRRARDGVLLVPEARGNLPRSHGRGEPDRDPARSRNARERVRPVPDSGAAPEAGRRPALGWGATDAQPRTRARQPTQVLIADEPTLGLAPLAADAVMQAIIELRDAGSAILLVEEHAENALMAADTVAFMELGTIVWVGLREDADMDLLTSAYLGTGR